MQYSKYQRFTSFFILFFFLFSTTFRFPLEQVEVYAENVSTKNIVSIIVEESAYNSLKGSIATYADNITKVLDNTQVVILPTPKNTTAYEIASLNESLYLEGFKSLNNGSSNAQLVGTLIIGDLSIPIAYENNNAQKTIVPYVDFTDKYFIYNINNGKYEKNDKNLNGLGVEIWHGIISPNLGNETENIQAINDFFGKTDSFYNGTGLFDSSKGVLNGNTKESLSSEYEPYVFYFDQIRESKATNLDSYNAYQAYIGNKEDILYKRYSEDLANKVKNEVLGSGNDTIKSLQEIFGDSIDLPEISGPELLNVPDIQTRHIINKTTKKFVEIFSKGSIGELRKNVHNAGRYNYTGNKVNVDFIPYLITILDGVNDEILKEANDDFELEIDRKVINVLQTNITVPTSMVITRGSSNSIAGVIPRTCQDANGNNYDCTVSAKASQNFGYGDHYLNMYFGKQGANLSNANECTIYRGSKNNGGTMVSASRAYNPETIQGDIDLLNSSPGDTSAVACLEGILSGRSLNGYFGKSSGLYIDQNKSQNGEIVLRNGFNLKGGFVEQFDIKGAKSINNSGITEASYKNCLENNFLKSRERRFSNKSLRTRYQIPLFGSPIRWTCDTFNQRDNYTKTFTQLNSEGKCRGLFCVEGERRISFKEIPSYVFHKSPTVEELKNQIQSGISQSLPVDKNRYIDFQDAAGNYKKIDYPFLFRFGIPKGEKNNFENFSFYFKKYLEENKDQFAGIDFYEYLQAKENKILKIGDDEKELTYYDSLIFAIYWNNLNSVSAKYKFVFQNYLSDQFVSTNEKEGLSKEDKFNLPKNKKQYEIAYLGAHGDSENMYVQMNPESKADNPYKDIILKNALLQSKLLAQNIDAGSSDEKKKENIFKCAPPEGVPIFEWIPAVVCWLDDMLPPTITVNQSTCGPTIPLLNQEEKDYLAECNGDVNKNSINDCLENKLNGGSIDLLSDGNRYYYNKPGKLSARILDSSDNVVSFNNSTKVKFELLRIEGIKDDKEEFVGSNIETVYSLGDDISIAKKYINFSSSTIAPSGGIAETFFTSKGVDANYIFQASLEVLDNKDQKEIVLLSDEIKVEVRGDRLFSTAYTFTQDSETGDIVTEIGGVDIVVSDQSQIFIVDSKQQNINDIQKIIYSNNTVSQKTIISLENISKGGAQLDLVYPLSLELIDDNEQVVNAKNISSKEELGNFYSFPGVTQAGHLTLKITDGNGFVSKKELDFISEEADHFNLDMGASIMDSNGAITSNVISILDKFDNIVSGRPYTLDITIDGDSIVFENNNEQESSSPVVEGYKIFRLLSQDKTGTNTIKFSLKDFVGDGVLSKETQVKVVEEININIIKNNNIKVGGDTYNLDIQIVDENNNLYSDINSRLYFSINSIHGSTTKSYFPVVNGVARVEIITTNFATKNAPIEIQVEGLRNIYEKNIKILHDVPAYVQLGMNQYAIEAADGNSSDVEVFIKDRFGNVTFDKQSGSAKIEIRPEYEKYISAESVSAKVVNGVSTLIINATDLPGIAYFKVDVNNLEAVGKIETYFYWNKKSIKDSGYNALYTTLLGAPYGDITQQDYLAGSLLFDKNNRALAVTSLLNNPISRNDVVMIEHNGGVTSIANPLDLSTDIQLSTSIENNKLVVSIKNKALGSYIGKIEPILGSNTQLNICHGGSGDFNHCSISKENTSIVLQSDFADYKGYSDSDSLYIQDQSGRRVFSINKNGVIQRDGKVYFELDENNEQKYLKIRIFSGNNYIGDIIYNFVGADITVSRNEELFSKTKNVLNNSIVLLLGGDQYSTADSYSEGNNNKVIYFNDPLGIENQLDNFSKGSLFAYENFIDQGGNGWSEGNKSLLQFAAGESVGESVKSYQSFGVITLGDPVLRLKKIQQDHPKLPGELKRFDATIGTSLSNKSTIESYEFLDYNKNGKQDIIIIHSDKYLELLENTDNQKNYRSLGNLAQIFDLGSFKNIKTGDFTGDGYDDIFFVNNQGDPYILNNFEKDFYRIDLREQFALSGAILQVEAFDMDNDGKQDIITLDDSGDVSIMYGGGTTRSPVFRKGATGLGGVPTAQLNNSPRTDRGAIYYKGLVSLGNAGDSSDIFLESEAFMAAIQENAENLGNFEGSGVNTNILDSLVFVQIPYKFSVLTGTDAQIMVESINTPLSAEVGAAIIESSEALDDFISSQTEGITYPESFPELSESDFIRSEYSETVGVRIEKRYSGDLKKGSKVDFELTITNTSNQTLQEVAYVEDIVTIFTLDETSINPSKPVQIRYDIPGYEFLIDDFVLAPGESFTLTAQLTTAPIKLGFIRVGLFEEGLVGDDVYGDVIYSNSAENCSQTVDIYRSIDTRKYLLGNKEPLCDTPLPPEIAKNVEDSDNNGIPDYIDNIVNGSKEDLQDYASGALLEIYKDTDQDGVPDFEDDTSSDKDFLSNLDEINENVDHIMSGIDNLLQGFSCGFGGGGCIATPLNWAPLAPGGDPTLFGYPIGDGLNVGEGIPIFSALTWMPYGPICGPSVWPVSPLNVGCTSLGAGGYLGTANPTNFFRLFVTPTLTGGVGVAACFGGPAIVAGYANFPGLHPLLPGGNCIVTAQPLTTCSSDGSDGDASTVGPSSTSSSGNGAGGVSIINANCTGDKKQVTELDLALVQEYLDYKTTGKKSKNFEDLFKESFSKIANPDSANIQQLLNEPLVTINGEGMDNELSVNIDFGAAKGGDFSDIIQIKNRRISPFPAFLMSWVTRQIEEIVTKLTDFPTVFIILPDFSGILDFGEKTENEGFGNFITANENLKVINENETVKSVNSGIKTAYTFMSNIPLITLQQESLNVDIPWVSGTEIDATLEKWGITIDQRKKELKRAQGAWSFGSACSYDNADEQKECEETNAAAEKITLQTQGLIGSLEKNLEVIQSYKEFPRKLNKFVQKKEDYLEQILCNVEVISEILGGWIGSNGERFKAWVELYILIKAILKSWQLLIDVFVDFEAQCAECKNERGDLMEFIWKLISAIIPQIPVIQFPKWPDIIIDLHNIRAGLVITLPELSFGTRPILLPSLPNLYLPDVPSVSINLPKIPILPTIEIPELPDLPVLPTIELPNLPPPPTLPKMFASLEGVLSILKAITKAMCILKTSPFVPEWRAGDQIAFITERQGFLPFDFIDISLPQFSYPFVDAIKVSTYVNLEFETDFITELSRQVTMPLTTFSNDFTQILNLGVDDLDFSGGPSSIEINLGADGVEGQIGYSQNDKALGFAIYISKGISELVTHLENGKNDTVSNGDFKKLVAEALASDVFVSHPKYNSFRAVWGEVFEYNFDKEDKFIADLEKNNFEKFDTLKNILHTEILKNKEFGKNIETYLQPNFIQKVDAQSSNDIDIYNEQLAVYNDRFRKSAVALVQSKGSPIQSDLQNRGRRLLANVSTPLDAFAAGNGGMNLSTTSTAHVPTGNSCEVAAKSPYRYKYKGLYVEMKPKITYRLFDYLDELNGREEIKSVDVDNDGDSDVIYMMNGQIFIKENLSSTPVHVSGGASITIDSDDNVFYNSDNFYSAVDNFREGSIDNNTINAKFSAATRQDMFNYRLVFNRLVDKTTKKISIVDAFSQVEEILFEKEEELFIFSKNLAYINRLGKLKDLQLTTKELINIRDDLQNESIVDISAGTKIYAGNNPVRLSYTIEGLADIRILVIEKYKNIELKSSIKVVGISGDAYIEGRYDVILQSEDIRKYLGMPIFPGAHFEYTGNLVSMDPMTYAEVEYYDGTDALLNFTLTEEYWLYDLGIKSKDYSITLDMQNDYIYATIRSFKEKLFSTYSKQILLSPQVESDSIAPSLFLQGIKIPVYQEKTIQLGEFLYDDGGLLELQPIVIDMDLGVDSDGDGNTKNDSDIPLENIIQTSTQVSVTFGEYDSLVKKKIGITLVDNNYNESFTEVGFEVYSPTPEIQSIQDSSLVGIIDEDLDEEPVSLYRYRGGVISKLKDEDGENTVLTQAGDYNFEIDTSNTGLTLTYAESIIATIAESTGKITLRDFSSQINVVSSNNFNNNDFYPKIEIIKDNSLIYYQYLKVSDVDTIEPVQDFDDITDIGIYVKFIDSENYGFYTLPETVSYNPGVFVIYSTTDENKQPLFILYPDGRIDTLNDFYTLEYSSYNDYIVLSLIDKKFDVQIAQVLFNIDGSYIMK